MLALHKKDSLQNRLLIAAHTNFGLSRTKSDTSNLEIELKRAHTKAAVFSTIKILEMLTEYIESHNKKLFVILSYSHGNVRKYLSGEEPFDLELLDYLDLQKYPYLDLRQAHMKEFKTCILSVEDYLSNYYIGHYAPPGNFFMAMAIRNEIIHWLDPKPKPYRKW